ncbi:MAG: prenyltransferase/squalene oxidase repeat-containing protein [Vicinamibacterales bacterium]
MTRLFAVVLLSALTIGPVTLSAQSKAGLTAETRKKLLDAVDRAAAYVVAQQKPTGVFENHLGITAVAANALLKLPKAARMKAQASAFKALDFLATQAKPDGGIYEKAIPHYMTAVSVSAFVAGGRAQDKPLINKGRQYLTEHVLDEGEGIKPEDKFYGGVGYGGLSDGGLADIISLEYSLQALKDSGLAANDPAWDKALKFLQRTQNASETNDQSWSGNDGGFIYYPGFSQAGQTLSYGAGTYAGMMSYSWANLKKSDPRVQNVFKWVRDNYTLEENPGLGQKTLYYYYMMFARGLNAYDQDVVIDAKGQRHNWREELGRKLLSLQNAEGYWVNTHPAELQTNKVLVTAFTLQAIEALLK